MGLLTRGAVAPLLVVGVALALAGCSNPGPGAADAGRAAADFATAVADGDGARACALLTPRAAQSLADDAETTCEQAVLADPVTSAVVPDGPPTGAPEPKAFGREAQVHLDGDVLFLAMAGGGWKVSAAGCTPLPDQPYDCVIEGS